MATAYARIPFICVSSPTLIPSSPTLYSCGGGNANQVWNTGYSASDLPQTSEEGQNGINNCSGDSSDSAM